MVGVLDGFYRARLRNLSGKPKANQINFGAEPDKLNLSKTPTIYSICPITHCK